MKKGLPLLFPSFTYKILKISFVQRLIFHCALFLLSLLSPLDTNLWKMNTQDIFEQILSKTINSNYQRPFQREGS